MRSTEEDGDSILSSDTGSVKKKRYEIFCLVAFLSKFYSDLSVSLENWPHVFICWYLSTHVFLFQSHKKNVKKNRMKALYAAVIEAREAGTNRRLCDLFMVKPSKKDYPDYYKVILEPVDLKTIEHNIKIEQYTTEEAMMDDMRLMFRNARHYNEEGSQVDACSARFGWTHQLGSQKYFLPFF